MSYYRYLHIESSARQMTDMPCNLRGRPIDPTANTPTVIAPTVNTPTVIAPKVITPTGNPTCCVIARNSSGANRDG